MTVSFVLEEGLPLSTLQRVVRSMTRAAADAGIRIVAGDTKVVERGKGDGIYVSATGIGRVLSEAPIDPSHVAPGQAVLVSGPLGDHGVSVLLARGDLPLHAEVRSDSASVWPLVSALLTAGVPVSCLRDPTRGGLIAALHEIAVAASVGVSIEEEAVPVRPEVADACELLGLDPMLVACEGRLVAWVDEAQAERALDVLREVSGGEHAARVGSTTERDPGLVVGRSAFGSERVLDLPSGEQLPRIC